MKTVFYTIVSDNYYYPTGTDKFINSFKRFHPDIDLVVFRQDFIDQEFKSKGINFFTAKPTFAKLLTPHYDLVVNIDADHIVLARLDEILKGDYDVAAPWNLNDYENRHFTTEDGKEITDEMFIQGGLVASTRKDFWDEYEARNQDAYKYLCAENDILNVIWYEGKYKTKILDKDNGLYYGCHLLGHEKDCTLVDGKVMYNDSWVKLYHNAKGPSFPKLNFEKLGFKKDVSDYMYVLGGYGTTVLYGAL
jgi:hypothetical protein